MIKTNIKRQLKLDKEEMKVLKKGNIISLKEIGNNWENLESRTKIGNLLEQSGQFNMYAENINLIGDYDCIIYVNNISVSLHNYHEENIVYYNEQECHCKEDQLFKVVSCTYEYEDNTFWFEILLDPFNNLDFEDEDEDITVYYEKNDRLYLEEVQELEAEEIENYFH